MAAERQTRPLRNDRVTCKAMGLETAVLRFSAAKLEQMPAQGKCKSVVSFASPPPGISCFCRSLKSRFALSCVPVYGDWYGVVLAWGVRRCSNTVSLFIHHKLTDIAGVPPGSHGAGLSFTGLSPV